MNYFVSKNITRIEKWDWIKLENLSYIETFYDFEVFLFKTNLAYELFFHKRKDAIKMIFLLKSKRKKKMKNVMMISTESPQGDKSCQKTQMCL